LADCKNCYTLRLGESFLPGEKSWILSPGKRKNSESAQSFLTSGWFEMRRTKRNGEDQTPFIIVGMHGQWTDLDPIGSVSRKGCFKFPHFGDSTFHGEMLNGRRLGRGIQVKPTNQLFVTTVILHFRI
jgi:hypothetical protein